MGQRPEKHTEEMFPVSKETSDAGRDLRHAANRVAVSVLSTPS